MKKVKKIISVIVIFEIAYLALANLALYLPQTQALLNQHKPDKYAISWERAWTWYPLRVHARGISANGQTSSQQWQADVASTSASLSILPLLTKTVHISNVEVENVNFQLRPRPKPEKDYASVNAFFPPIEGRDSDLPAVPKAKKEGRGWTIEVDDIVAQGTHDVWLYQVRGAIKGELAASLSYTSRGGPFSLSDGVADIKVDALSINEEPVIHNGGSLSGEFEMAPFVPSENKGLQSMGFLTADAQLGLAVDSLDFLDVYLLRFDGMKIDGKGVWRGRLNLDKGDVVAGTDMTISASELTLNAAQYRVAGAGQITIGVNAEVPKRLNIGVLFGELQAFHVDQPEPLIKGESLALDIEGDNRILQDDQRKRGTGRVVVKIPSIAVPDLAAYQHLLPEQWPLQLNGGTGELAGEVELSSSSLEMDLKLISDNADMALNNYRFVTSLDFGVKATGGATDTADLDISGVSFL